ncbi:granulins-like isoform X4 [Labeo rohita]|uniref:Granulins-like isoform X4 n=1 Tax=Labeo rohita TaxID=84645 RepID=A0A498L823_LABRO|nr:granulins-like isoform X4 [Labeo rohita]
MIPSLPVSEDDITCPDGSFCPAEFSCLLMASSYGCCPVAQGLVCSDGKHCCPKDHECSADSSSCVKLKEPETVLCGNGTSECPVDTTCCKTEDGQWACCPMPKAVCCDDKIHCCPEDSVCDIKASKCISSTNKELPMWAKFPARVRAEWENHKPAEMRAKPELTTTRQITTAGNQMTTLPGAPPKTSDVPCNDTAACPDGSTCCKTQEGGWACCPLPKAVCCEDFIHCCPTGKICNVSAETCEDPSGSEPWFKKLPVKIIRRQNVTVKQVHLNVQCDDTTSCEDGETCCKTQEGGWACCPLPQAVCCEDFTHCCPHGKKCNTAAGTCEDPLGSEPWFEKVPAKTISRQNVTVKQDVPCNDTAACPDGSTCCKTKEGGWACCPLPEAVCCDDFIHCCPHGTTCNVAAGSCDESSGSRPWFEKLPVKQISSQNVAVTPVSSVHSNVTCDSTKSCPDGSTCCKTQEGGWACCPLPEAVCCDDFIHCCPHGTTCNVAAGSCDESSGSRPWLEKLPAFTTAGQRSPGNVNCDSTHVCPDSNTCCKNIDGDWGCCPLPEAVCCTDGEHCCPANYKCDVSRVSCIKGDVVIPWYNKISTQSTPAPSLDFGAVKCDKQSSCSADSTCCHLSTGEWGCCPYPEAVCCPDQQHCCPTGYRCDLHRRSCIKTTWLHVEIVPLAYIGGQNPQSSVSEKGIQCGGGYSCQDSQTCCPTSQTTWGCCPSPKAVCCDDMTHCCPAGYKCGEGGTCTSSVGFDWNNWNNWRVFFSKKKRATTL